MKKLFIIICTTFIVGCAQIGSQVDVPNIIESESIKLVDLRPEHEKENEMLSLWITSDAYGITRLRDSSVKPTPTRLLQHRAYEKLDSEVNVSEIIVHHMVVYINMQSQLKGMAIGGVLAGPLGGAVASLMQDNTVNSINSLVNREEFEAMLAADDEYLRATYTKAENPNETSVFVTYIDAEINGKRSFVRTMTPATLPEGVNAHVASVETAISYFLNQYN